jgi:hypothetical protein
MMLEREAKKARGRGRNGGCVVNKLGVLVQQLYEKKTKDSGKKSSLKRGFFLSFLKIGK